MSRRVNFYGYSYNSGPVWEPFFTQFTDGLEGFSFDRLVDGYAGALVSIVRPNALATTDVYLNDNAIDQQAILDFVGNQKALVRKVWGQLGNYNLIQNTVAKMPYIADGGAVMTDGGKPCMVFDGVDDTLTVEGVFTFSNAFLSMYYLRTMLSVTGTRFALLLREGASGQVYDWHVGAINTMSYRDAERYFLPRVNTRQLKDLISNGGTTSFHVNGNLEASAVPLNTAGIATISIASHKDFGLFGSINFQELILFDNADRSAEQPAITANINSRYNVF